MNTSIRSLRKFAIILLAMGLAGSAVAQQATLRLRVIDPATKKKTRTNRIGNRNVVEFVDRNSRASTEKPRPQRSAVQSVPEPGRQIQESGQEKLTRKTKVRTQSFEPATRIERVQARDIPPVPSPYHRAGRLPTYAPISSRVRLVQADDDPDSLLDALSSAADEGDEFDNLLERARDIVDREADGVGDMTSDEARRRVQDDLDSLLSDENDNNRSPLNLGDDDSGAGADSFDESQFIDPTPDPIRRRVNRGNQPYTLGSIFQDEVYDPQCVQQYCNAVWNCAGGRCQNWWDRFKRNINRDQLVRNSQCCGLPPSPMANFRCPKIPRQNDQCMNQPTGQPTLASPPGGDCWDPVYGDGMGGVIVQPGMDGMNYDPVPTDMGPAGPDELSPVPADLPAEMDGPLGDLDI